MIEITTPLMHSAIAGIFANVICYKEVDVESIKQTVVAISIATIAKQIFIHFVKSGLRIGGISTPAIEITGALVELGIYYYYLHNRNDQEHNDTLANFGITHFLKNHFVRYLPLPVFV